MKHKIQASSYGAFSTLYDGLMARLKQTNQVIVKSEFCLDNDSHKGFRAKVWTKKGGATDGVQSAS